MQALTATVDTQNKVVNSYEKYMDLFNVEDFDKRIKFQLDNQKFQLSNLYMKEARKLAENVMKETADGVIKEKVKWMPAWTELSQIMLSVALEQFPNKSDKPQRDAHFKLYYPHNCLYFINFCDAYFEKIEPMTSGSD